MTCWSCLLFAAQLVAKKQVVADFSKKHVAKILVGVGTASFARSFVGVFAGSYYCDHTCNSVSLIITWLLNLSMLLTLITPTTWTTSLASCSNGHMYVGFLVYKHIPQALILGSIPLSYVI